MPAPAGVNCASFTHQSQNQDRSRSPYQLLSQGYDKFPAEIRDDTHPHEAGGNLKPWPPEATTNPYCSIDCSTNCERALPETTKARGCGPRRSSGGRI